MYDTDGDAGRLKSEADEPGWEVDPDDDWGVAVVATVGRQLKLRREAVGMRAPSSGSWSGTGRTWSTKSRGVSGSLSPEYLDQSDEVLAAGGLISAMKEDVARVRYPKKVREIAKLEATAVEIGLYSNHDVVACRPGAHAGALRRVASCLFGRGDGAHGGRADGPAVDFREVARTDPQLRPGRGDASPSGWRENGVASAARTSGGVRAVAERIDPGDADRLSRNTSARAG